MNIQMIGSVLKKILLMANTLLKKIIAMYATNKIVVINSVLQNLKILIRPLNIYLSKDIKIMFNPLITRSKTITYCVRSDALIARPF